MYMVSSEQLREAVGRFATGVTVIATLEDGGKVHGMTANAVASVSLTPPLVLVCIGYQRNTHRHIRRDGQFSINVLERSQMDVAEYYSADERARVQDSPGAYELTQRGTPRLRGAISFMDCDVVASHDHGDHTVFIGAVKYSATQPGEPLLFYASRFASLTGRMYV